MTANGWDSDGAAGERAGDESAQAASVPGASEPAGAQTEPADSSAVSGPEAAGAEAPGFDAASPGVPGLELPGLQLPGLQLPGLLTSDSLVPGMTVRSPALDYMLGRQRRRVRHVGAVVASVLAIALVAAVIVIAVHRSGANTANPPQLTAAQVVQQAARQQLGLNSESATISEHISGATTATLDGTVELQRKPLLMSMNLNLSGAASGQRATIRAIVTSSVMYMKLGGMAGMPAALAAKWLRIPLTGLSQSSYFAILQHELQNENPTSQFAGLNTASHLRAVGSQMVSGVTTTKYTGSFAPSAAVKALPAAQRKVLAPGLDMIKGDVVFSVWVDSSHYVREIQETEHTSVITITLEGTYGSFNQPVKIPLPPSSQIFAPPLSALNE